MIGYPTYRFNRAGSQVRVENAEEDRALQGEWFDHPPTDESIAVVLDDDVMDDVDAMIEEETKASKKKKKK